MWLPTSCRCFRQSNRIRVDTDQRYRFSQRDPQLAQLLLQSLFDGGVVVVIDEIAELIRVIRQVVQYPVPGVVPRVDPLLGANASPVGTGPATPVYIKQKCGLSLLRRTKCANCSLDKIASKLKVNTSTVIWLDRESRRSRR